MPKILIIRFSSIGDIVLTTPVVRNIKKQIPGAELHYCTKSKFKSVLEHNPYIDKFHFLEDDLSDLISRLKKENFDTVIDLHRNLRSFIIKTSLNKKSYTFDKLNFKKWLLVNLKINKLPKIHIVDRYMKVVEKLAVKNDNEGLDYFMNEKDMVNLSDFPETHRNGYIAFAIGAQHNTKKLPKERIVELCKKINLPIILLGDHNDKIAGDYVEQKLKENNKNIIFNACGKYSLNQSASIVKEATKVFSHDTGLMHIASAFKKEIYSIWGNTVPEFGMYPYQTKYHILERANLKCRPCSKIGYPKCPLIHFKCMNEISFDSIDLKQKSL
ncbi:MAG: glycosyltransferase family 9 protein [Cytophagaceae bacterium]|nr:glycosyltransferase family 9 protein [Cytophagaceae bacterium]